MRIKAGNLNRKVSLLQPTPAVDASGGPIVTYAAVATRWCQRLRFMGVEVEREPQRQPTATVQLLMRLDSLTATITTEWQIEFEGMRLIIAGLDRNPADGSLIINGQAPQQ